MERMERCKGWSRWRESVETLGESLWEELKPGVWKKAVTLSGASCTSPIVSRVNLLVEA